MHKCEPLFQQPLHLLILNWHFSNCRAGWHYISMLYNVQCNIICVNKTVHVLEWQTKSRSSPRNFSSSDGGHICTMYIVKNKMLQSMDFDCLYYWNRRHIFNYWRIVKLLLFIHVSIISSRCAGLQVHTYITRILSNGNTM